MGEFFRAAKQPLHESHGLVDGLDGVVALREAVRQKVAHFFERLGAVEATDVWRAVLAQVERPLIERCLAWAGGNQLKASRVLGINRNTLRKKNPPGNSRSPWS